MEFVLYIKCALQLVSVILNSLGIYFLRKMPPQMSNQASLLMNLSSVQLLLAVSSILRLVMDICRTEICVLLSMILEGFEWYFYFVYLFSPSIIMLDRFIGVMHAMRYMNLFPEKRARLIIVVSWILGLVLLVPRLFYRSFRYFGPIVAFTMELSNLGFFITAFTLMAFKIRKHKQTFSNSRVQSRISKVAGLIIGSFVLLVLLPELTMTIVLIVSANIDGVNIYTKEYYYLVYLIICLTYIVDPIIYLYGYPPLREAVKCRILQRT